jgi:hypothetical protein
MRVSKRYTCPSESKWEEIIAASEHSYFFHTPAWARILEETYGGKIATRLYEIDGKEILVPMMKHKRHGFYLYSSMEHGYGGILSTSELSPEVFQKILKDILSGKSLLFTMSLPPFVDLPVQKGIFIKEVNSEWNYTHVLSLEKGFEYLWKNKFKRDLKRGIMKAEGNNIKIINTNELEYFRMFYSLYENRSKVWGYNVPPHPWKFYENLHKFGSPYVQLRLAVKDDKMIAGLITFEYSDNIFRWMNASLEEYFEYYPNNLLDKELIKYACENGFKYYNFGASGNLEGVRKFKERFGAEKVEVKQYFVQSRLGKLARMVLKR